MTIIMNRPYKNVEYLLVIKIRSNLLWSRLVCLIFLQAGDWAAAAVLSY